MTEDINIARKISFPLAKAKKALEQIGRQNPQIPRSWEKFQAVAPLILNDHLNNYFYETDDMNR